MTPDQAHRTYRRHLSLGSIATNALRDRIDALPDAQAAAVQSAAITRLQDHDRPDTLTIHNTIHSALPA